MGQKGFFDVERRLEAISALGDPLETIAKTAVLPGEDLAEFEELHSALIQEWAPVGPTEEDAVLSIAKGVWRKRRAQKLLQARILVCRFAHDRATLLMSQCAQTCEAASERWGERRVGKVMKALVSPEGIDGRRNVLPGAQAAQRRHVLVSDRRSRERFGKDVAIVLRVRARTRNAAHIDQERDLRSFEQIDEFVHRAG
jgi:hypothetical protein